jgi:hypothetical protein
MGSITYDKNLNNNSISLKIDSNTVAFSKGVLAHATSNIILLINQDFQNFGLSLKKMEFVKQLQKLVQTY